MGRMIWLCACCGMLRRKQDQGADVQSSHALLTAECQERTTVRVACCIRCLLTACVLANQVNWLGLCVDLTGRQMALRAVAAGSTSSITSASSHLLVLVLVLVALVTSSRRRTTSSTPALATAFRFRRTSSARRVQLSRPDDLQRERGDVDVRGERPPSTSRSVEALRLVESASRASCIFLCSRKHTWYMYKQKQKNTLKKCRDEKREVINNTSSQTNLIL